MLHLAPRILDVVVGAGTAAYPAECCGLLLGPCGRDAGRRDADAERRVVRALPVENAWGDGRDRRYLIDPLVLLRAELDAARDGLSVVGVYHSHPNAPAQPSEFDRAHAWPWYSYLIASVRDGRPADVRAWRLGDDRARFDEEPVRVTPSIPDYPQ